MKLSQTKQMTQDKYKGETGKLFKVAISDDTKNWKERFDEKFRVDEQTKLSGKDVIKHNQQIKSFISNLLDKQREEICEELEGMKPKHYHSDEEPLTAKKIGITKTLDQAIDQILELRSKYIK